MYRTNSLVCTCLSGEELKLYHINTHLPALLAPEFLLNGEVTYQYLQSNTGTSYSCLKSRMLMPFNSPVLQQKFQTKLQT